MKNKGFLTIATGDKHYYEIAANLLLSYRWFSKEPLPFAIIAEEENEYTALFDDVIIVENARRSFMDKFLVLKLAPYDETIFFDADSLAYGDLNAYWDFFKDATDFSATGCNYEPDEAGAWYDLDGIGKYADKIAHKTRVHAGVFYVRKSDKLDKLYNDCKDIESNYKSLKFHTCPNSYDECILGVALPMNGMKAINENIKLLAFYPCLKSISTNMLNGKLKCTAGWGTSTDDGVLLHYGTVETKKPLYIYNVECLNFLYKSQNTKITFCDFILYKCSVKYLLIYLSWLIKKIRNKIFG